MLCDTDITYLEKNHGEWGFFKNPYFEKKKKKKQKKQKKTQKIGGFHSLPPFFRPFELSARTAFRFKFISFFRGLGARKCFFLPLSLKPPRSTTPSIAYHKCIKVNTRNPSTALAHDMQ